MMMTHLNTLKQKHDHPMHQIATTALNNDKWPKKHLDEWVTGEHVTVSFSQNVSGLKSKPAELSQEDIEAAKKEWENIVLSEGEDSEM